jgi:hypothetical protein
MTKIKKKSTGTLGKEKRDGVRVSTQVVNGLGPMEKSGELVLGREDMAHAGPNHEIFC